MMKVPLTQGKYALIDDEDYSKIKGYSWCFHTKEGYAITSVYKVNPNRPKGQTTYSMHRLIMQTPKGLQTDHINGNKLDNRKSNLRICTKSQNQVNAPARKDNKSGYRGVSPKGKKWAAIISSGGKKEWLGVFETPAMAASAYNKRAQQLFGEFAWFNDIP